MESNTLLPVTTKKTKQYLEKIGEIIVQFGHLESLVEFFIWELIQAGVDARDSQNIGRRITTPLFFKQKIDLAKSLIVEQVGKEEAAKFMPIYKDLVQCGLIRNDIAHSQWYIEYGNKEEAVLPLTKKYNPKRIFDKKKNFNFNKAMENVSLEELASNLNKISETAINFSQFLTKALKMV